MKTTSDRYRDPIINMSKKTPQVSNVEVETLGYKIEGIYKKHEAQLKALLPEKLKQRISIVLKNTNTRVANGLRRTIIEEMPIKVLNVDVENIETDEEYLIRDQLCDHIALIPLDQDVPNNMVFELDYVNDNAEDRLDDVFSEDIYKQSGSGPSTPFGLRFKLAEMHPTKHLRVKDIHVIEGYGYTHAKFIPVGAVNYEILDYIEITEITDRGFLAKQMVKTSDVLAATKGFNERTIHNERILVIPHSSHKAKVPAERAIRLNKFSITINKKLRYWNSSEVHPEVFRLTFNTLGNYPAKKLIKDGCKNICNRLQDVYDHLEPFLKDHMAPPSHLVHARITPDITHVDIYGETHTIGEILIYNVWRIDPNVALVNKTLIHSLERDITINIIHGDPIRILMDACKMGIDDFKAIEKQV